MKNSTTTKNQPHLTVTGTIDDVLAWVVKMGERGIYNSNTARFKRTAIEKFVTVLGPDEPRTAQYLSENIESLAHRWTTKENANPETGRTYRSRAHGALADYLAYQEDPNSIKPRKGPPRGTKAKKAAAKEAAAKEEVPRNNSQPPSPDTGSVGADPGTGPKMRTFPLGKEREDFMYRMPPGTTVSDVIKIACHLVTMAEDFDPMNANTTALFQLATAQQKPD